MSIEALTFVLGAVLLLTGILGGGFQIKDLRIPKVDRVPRVAATVCGLGFIGVGLMNVRPDPHKVEKRSVTFTIQDRLGTGQVSEQVDVLINGEFKGQLTVNEHYPTATLRITVPGAGTYSYTIRAVAHFEGQDDEYVGTGQGSIEVASGKVFELEAGIIGNTFLVSLVDTGDQQGGRPATISDAIR